MISMDFELLDCSRKSMQADDNGPTASVTRLGDFLLFGKLFKAGGNNYSTQIAHFVRQFS